MIVTKLQGGLGNQMFQWAATYSAAKTHNVNFYFDLSYFKSINKPSQWTLDILKFNKISLVEKKFTDGLKFLKDTGDLISIPDNVFLDGFWQSEKYFIEIEKEIRDFYQFDEDIKNYLLNKYPILNENTVSMHIRRGDYIKYPKIHPMQNIDYYKNAYEKINDPLVNVLLFSDDIGWCKENLNFPNSHFIEGENNIVDLCAISMCKHHIISNSSFSWWGAWLNPNQEKQVIAPTEWMGDESKYNDEFIIPSNWIKI